MKNFKKFLKCIFITLILAIIIIISVIFFNGHSLYSSTIAELPVEKTIEEIRSQENFVTYDEVPEIFINAVVSVEDKRFFSHSGFDLISIGRAIVTNIKDKELSEGGSTITQQIAKNIFFSQKKEFTRKVAEVFVALDIEKLYSKKEILEIYINTNFYGSGYYGIYEAAQGYYEKDVSELTDYEATLLAGVPNAPSVYSPKVNLSLAERRQSIVLEKMVEAGYLSADEAKKIEDMQITK